MLNIGKNLKLDPVGSTVRYEMMKLCAGSVYDTMSRAEWKTQKLESKNRKADYLPRHSPDVRTVFEI